MEKLKNFSKKLLSVMLAVLLISQMVPMSTTVYADTYDFVFELGGDDQTTTSPDMYTSDKHQPSTSSSNESVAKGTITGYGTGHQYKKTSGTVTVSPGSTPGTAKVTLTYYINSYPDGWTEHTKDYSVAVKGLVLDKTSVEMEVGETSTVTATGFDLNESGDAVTSVTWTSSDEGVATVNENGVITGVSAGTTAVTATCGNYKKQVSVTVNPVVSITLDKDSLYLAGNNPITGKLTATTDPEDATVTWSVTGNNITVDQDGNVTAVSKGSATVTASVTVDGVTKTASATVKVGNMPPVVTVTPKTKTLNEGSTVTLSAKVTNGGNNPAVSLSSSNTAVATVNNGVVTAVAAGKAVITATYAYGNNQTSTDTATIDVVNQKNGIVLTYVETVDDYYNINESGDKYNYMKFKYEFVDANGTAVDAPAGFSGSDLVFDENTISVADDLIPNLPNFEGFTLDSVVAYFWWGGDMKGNKFSVTEITNAGRISDNYPGYISYLGFAAVHPTDPKAIGNDYNNNPYGYYAYNPTGTLRVVYVKVDAQTLKTTYVSNGTQVRQETDTPIWSVDKYTYKPVDLRSELTADYMNANYAPAGKTFSHWSLTENGTAVDDSVFTNTTDKDVTLYAVYENIEYTITYVMNGGTNAASNPYKYTVESDTITLADPSKTGYTFAGWYSDAEFNTQSNSIPKGSIGNKTFYAKWTPNSDTVYKTYHYTEELDGTWNLHNTVTSKGTTGEHVTASPLTGLTGFTNDLTVTGTVKEGDIAADGSLVLKLYYTRNSYKVTYEYTGTVPSTASALPEEATVKYEAEVTVADPATAPGYTFHGWTTTDVTVGEDGKFTMPAKPVKITGYFTANTDTPYKVEHYQQNLADDNYTLADTENLKGTTDATVNATAKTYTGFTYDENVTGTVASGTVAADGSLVLKLYYTRNTYSVTYEFTGDVPDGHTEPTDNNKYKYGYSFTADTVIDPVTGEGKYVPGATFRKTDSDLNVIGVYTFEGWDPATTTIENDLKVTGKWTYKQAEYTLTTEATNATVTPDPAETTYEYSATATTEVTFTADDHYHITSVTVDGTPLTADEIAVGSVTVDHKKDHTVVVTAEIDTYKVTWLNYNGALLEEDTEVAYGTIPSYDSATPTRSSDGTYTYTFSGWNPTISEVTEDVTYTARFTPAAIPVPPGPPIVPPTPDSTPVPTPPGPPITPDVTPTPDPTPDPTPVEPEVIPEDTTPEAGEQPVWALANLLMSIGAAILSVVTLLFKKKNDDEEETDENGVRVVKSEEDEEEDDKYERRTWPKALGVVIAVVGAVLFILTENMSNPMVWFDKYTIA
ncbi:MAG: Ig-like domain-containing protein, partial [Erysipelotrichaceae bacterium]|nr:Ig-like domain-containing protein [Erysipelotrichaceae bacterium]